MQHVFHRSAHWINRRATLPMAGATGFLPILLVFLLTLSALTPTQVVAQTPTYSYSAATGGNAIPWNPISTTFQKYQGFYGPGIFAGATPGFITHVYWQRYSASTGTTYTNLAISLGQSSSGNFSTSAFFTPVTLGYSATSTTIPAGATGSWWRIQLQTPFYYNPNQYLVVQICSDGITGTGITALDGGPMTSPAIGRIYGGGSGCNTTTPSGYTNNYHQNFGFDLSSPFQNDAGISALISPVNFCAGTEDIVVRLSNYGTNTLNSVTINWSYDGVVQTPISYSTPLASLATTNITLGTRTFASGAAHPLVAWTTAPNGQYDSLSANDSLVASLKPALSGTFTIGGAAPDYTTFAAAAADLNLNGICGPVVFNVRSGTYNEQINLQNIPGASAINTITFQSETGNRADVNVTYNAGSANNYVLAYNGCKFVTFKNMTMTATNVTYANVFLLQGGAQNCTIDGLDLIGIPTTNTSTTTAVVYSPSGSLDHYTTIRNCNIRNGGSAMYMYGGSSVSMEMGDVIENNNITNFYYGGVWSYYLGDVVFRGNTVQTTNSYTNYLSYFYYNLGQIRIEKNKFIGNGPTGTKYGMYLGYCTANPGQEGLIANNFFMTSGSGTTYTMYPSYSNYQRFYHNSVYTNATSLSYLVYSPGGSGYEFKNNIFHNDGPGYAWYNGTATNTLASDYNVLYTNGANIGYWNGLRADLGAFQAASGMDGNSISKSAVFVAKAMGDLHLTGFSEDDPDLTGTLLAAVTEDIDGEGRILPYRGADEACYITPGTVWYELTDASGTPAPYANVPGTFGVHYHVEFPDFDANITITLKFYSIPGNVLTYTNSFQVSKLFGQTLDGLQLVNLSGIAPGVYRVEGVFNTKNSCGGYRLYIPSQESFMILPAGSVPCIVWPGDVNNDGILNYGDRKSLTQYIHDANLSPIWLNGPARYRADAAQNPFTYMEWVAQAAIPWQTPEGCYMDADGNGTVNSFDFIVMKLNWMRSHDPSPKSGDDFNTISFDMSQNYPNPFNPTTRIQYSVPERSQVNIVVTDLNGRTIATLVEGTVDAGVRIATFDGSGLSSGSYIVTATMQGLDSGLDFSKTIRMTLSK